MGRNDDIFFATPNQHAVEAAQKNVSELVAFNENLNTSQFNASEPRQVRNVGIIGAGKMGASIAAATIQHQIPVIVTDSDSRVLERFVESVFQHLDEDPHYQSDGKLDANSLIQTTQEKAAIAQCDIVIESIVELIAAKEQVYKEYEPLLAESSVFATNTSTLPISKLSTKIADKRRFCGIHFLLPVAERPLIEIVRGLDATAETIGKAIAYAKAIAKIPLVVNDDPGFLINRLLMPYVSEAMKMLQEGASIEAIEEVALNFGMDLGPLSLLDVIGIDVALNSGWVFAGAYPDVLPRSPLLVPLKKAGRLGRKSGAGFLTYDEGNATGRHDPAVDAIIKKWQDGERQHSQRSIAMRLLLPMLLEATRILQDNTVTDPRMVDLGVVFGLGFPKSRGGLLYWADSIRSVRILDLLKEIEFLGPRVHPTSLLETVAGRSSGFYHS